MFSLRPNDDERACGLIPSARAIRLAVGLSRPMSKGRTWLWVCASARCAPCRGTAATGIHSSTWGSTRQLKRQRHAAIASAHGYQTGRGSMWPIAIVN